MDVSHEEPKFVYQMTKETQSINQYTITIVDSNIDEIVTQVLTMHNNGITKLTLTLKVVTPSQNMLKAIGSSVLDPPRHNMGGENQGIGIPSHIRPFLLHMDVVL